MIKENLSEKTIEIEMNQDVNSEMTKGRDLLEIINDNKYQARKVE